MVVAKARDLICLSVEGEVETIPLGHAASWLHDRPVMLCNSRLLARRLGLERLIAFDVLELYAFTRPAEPGVPTPTGLALALQLTPPESPVQACLSIAQIAGSLLRELTAQSSPVVGALAAAMGKSGWLWAPYVLAAMGLAATEFNIEDLKRALHVWRRLPEWQEDALPAPPGQRPVTPGEARQRLAAMVKSATGSRSEPRPQQADYTSAISFAFTPREAEFTPQAVLAEAGTGVGKTLGYLAPATIWAERNGAPVWISTYTRNLQQQVDQSLRAYYGDDETARQKIVVRKGRENYLCLLNMEEALRSTSLQPVVPVVLGLLARWAAATRDGDFTGDFPYWLVDLYGRNRTLGLSDRRGECIYAACDHYKKCFIEHSIRRARQAEIVVANHALVMIQAANASSDDTYRPTRYVFDEGHHLFDTADSAFAANLSGQETAELRQWLIGAEASTRSRARGLRRRVQDLIEEYPELDANVDHIGEAARALPSEGWLNRIGSGAPNGPLESFLEIVRRQVYARASETDNAYSLEAEINPPLDGLIEAARTAYKALQKLAAPLNALIRDLSALLDDEAKTLTEERRRKIEAVTRSLRQRAALTVLSWQQMLQSIGGETPPIFVDWLHIERIEGRDLDVGFSRHYVDPTQPLADVLTGQAHGIVITSATLTDDTGDTALDWAAAEMQSGTRHLPKPAMRAQMTSPFDYKAATRIYVVRDVKKTDIDHVAAAYRELFLAAGGGALGLFTAIQRLRGVYDRIAAPLEAAGIDLYAQHVDGLNPSTLVDIFRAEEHSCLLGTDAIRDGVDVPGRALRMIVFDRVPWSRPNLLYKARREAFGGSAYEDRLTRLRLKQAFGRLIRREGDRGVFVLLDGMLPSRLTAAFPPEVEIVRTGLAEAIAGAREFLSHDGNQLQPD